MGKTIFRLAVIILTVIAIVASLATEIAVLASRPDHHELHFSALAPTLLITTLGGAAVMLTFIYSLSAFQKWALRRAEARIFQQPDQMKKQKNLHKLSFMMFPIAPTVQIILAGISMSIVSSLDSEYWMLYEMFVLIAAIVVITLAFSEHFRPNGNRSMKYELLMCGLELMNIFALFSRWENTKYDPSSMPIAALKLGIAFTTCLIIAMGYTLLAGMFSLLKQPTRKKTLWIQKIYRAVIIGGPIFCATFLFFQIPIPGILYLLVRYFLIEHMAERPILYFRSFRYADTPSAFGNIVLPVASRYGVVVALADDTQPPSSLVAGAEASTFPQLFVLSNEEWRRWVISKLRNCSAVILDRSQDSVSLAWEFQRALEFVEPSRIAVVYQGTESDSSAGDRAAGIFALRYSLGRLEEKLARQLLKRWFASLQ